MNYPNKKDTYEKRPISEANRGMSLEDDINQSNEYYLKQDIAIIHKKPTPVTIVHVDYPKRSAAKITEAYFKLPSTTDYNGIYKGKYIDFEAKECNSRTAFPFYCIHPHQVEHLRKVLKHGAIAFIIIRMTQYDTDYFVDAGEFIEIYSTIERKSLPYDWIRQHGIPIERKYSIPCNYIKIVERYLSSKEA